jgi:hypothetical protein
MQPFTLLTWTGSSVGISGPSQIVLSLMSAVLEELVPFWTAMECNALSSQHIGQMDEFGQAAALTLQRHQFLVPEGRVPHQRQRAHCTLLHE